ncbi:hypothetical protein C8J56DRAFT_989280 [Mycena floridula]|nr:hypothetical protein C8J56DRAFT_989280 [Mycena floridula]
MPEDDQTSNFSVKSVNPTPDTLTKLIKRLRALTLELLPVEVSPEAINEPTSRIITPAVIGAFMAAAGDFLEPLPYCLLRARAEFMWDANHNPADYGENVGRATACEVLARRIVHLISPDRQTTVMSTRFKHRQIDGDISDMASALEMAIDSHCTIFLSSSEAQDVVQSLWKGDIVQENNEHHDIDYVRYADLRLESIWDHLDPSRLSVPRYQNMFRIVIWLCFLVVYSQAVRQPTERLDPSNNWSFDEWEIALYILALSFFLEDMHKFFKLLRFVTWRAFTFWNIVSFLTDSLLMTAFVFRLIGLRSNGDQATAVRTTSFQVLSFVSPLIWMKLITVFDGYKYVGMMQICVARMLQESGIFIALLSVLAIGFAQAMYALDAADGATEAPSVVVNALVQSLLQSPDFQKFSDSESPAGLILFYLWNVVTAIILLNVLISLFSSAYEDVVDDAEAQYLAFFAGKTVGMVRAPDSYVYPAPFNLIEAAFISPLEFVPFFPISNKTYAKLNRIVMRILFLFPLTLVALYESTRGNDKHAWMKNWLRGDDEGDESYPETRDPEVEDSDGLKISTTPFSELIKVFPNTSQSSDALLAKEIQDLKGQLDQVIKLLNSSGIKAQA